MSHDDIRAALVRDQQRGGRFPADPELQHKAADWLAELLAENERLTARAEAAEQTIQRVRELHHSTPLTGTWGDCANGDCTHEDPCPEETRDVCAHCVDIFGELECVQIAIPCETIRALDGGER